MFIVREIRLIARIFTINVKANKQTKIFLHIIKNKLLHFIIYLFAWGFEQLPCKQMAFKKRARKEIFEYH